MRHKRCTTHIFTVGWVMLAIVLPVSAFAQDGTAEPLQVVTKVIEPFVFIEDETYSGFSIDLWDVIASRLDVAYEFVEVETVQEQIEAVEAGDADLGIAAISVTAAREERIDFSYPFFNAGLQIMTRVDGDHGLLTVLRSGLSRQLFEVMGIFVVLLLVASHLVWLVERRRNEDFPKRYKRGIWEAFWWAAVTVTTVGYGDKAPKTSLGRIIGIVWMLGGLFLIAYFTAEVAAAFTLQEIRGTINDISDLPGKRVVTVAGSTADDYLTDVRIGHSEVDTIEQAYARLLVGTSQAIVYDSPVLLFYASGEGRGRVQIVGDLLEQQGYGIALPTDSPLREPINQAILELLEDGTYDRLHQRWFGTP